MEKLIKSLTIALEAIKEYLSNCEEVTVKQRLNNLLEEGNFGARFNKCRFKRKFIPFLDEVKGLICKELKVIILYSKLSKQQERICRARRFVVIYVDDKYSVKQLEKELIDNELL